MKAAELEESWKRTKISTQHSQIHQLLPKWGLTALTTYDALEKKNRLDDLRFCLKKLEKEQMKSKVSTRN